MRLQILVECTVKYNRVSWIVWILREVKFSNENKWLMSMIIKDKQATAEVNMNEPYTTVGVFVVFMLFANAVMIPFVRKKIKKYCWR